MDLKEGTVICKRQNNWHKSYTWKFEKVKKITPTGKIRLENGDLLNSLEPYKVYDKEMETIYNQDMLKENLKDMIYYTFNERDDIIKNLSIDEVMKFGNLFKDLKIEDMKDLAMFSDTKRYKKCLNKFEEYESKL